VSAVRVNAGHMIDEFCQNNHLSHLFLVMIFTARGTRQDCDESPEGTSS
jgi:hypothetical protein